MWWFARLFGSRVEDREDDEPARFPMMQPGLPDQTAVIRAPSSPPSVKGKTKGFDPYNSGSFERRNAWEKVSKR